MTGPAMARIALAARIGETPRFYRYYRTPERAERKAIEARMYFGSVHVEVRDALGAWVSAAQGPVRRAARAVDFARLATALRRRDPIAAHWFGVVATDMGTSMSIVVEPSVEALFEREGIPLMTAVGAATVTAGGGSILPAEVPAPERPVAARKTSSRAKRESKTGERTV